ncbi:MAG: nucleotidyl transferase AbiEii/AbiGii toxin family protein [Candidatus Kerfeldbacteria bacterium]|nr:nucleotidyl transferase AbiEii/AbiGii toxin family protein [Candidatus Kerfeldbacteria bacterium]
MITQDSIRQLANQYHTSEHPNIVREYFQHLFLSELYKISDAEHLLFKGGTALRILYGSPRFSEDLDFSLFSVPERERTRLVESLFEKVLVSVERSGIAVTYGPKPGPTREGYFGSASFVLFDYPPVEIEINVSERNGRTVEGEVNTIASLFVPTYNIFHLPQIDLVHEKVFGALLGRKKERDFYDLYFLLRKNMLSGEQKKKLAPYAQEIIAEAELRDFALELGVFLPADQQSIVKSFAATLKGEIDRQLS